jgi:hypothetical protein
VSSASFDSAGDPVKSSASCPWAKHHRTAQAGDGCRRDVWLLIAFDAAAFVAAVCLVWSVPESLEQSARTANAPVTLAAYRAALCD